jgi:hypothetical protein
VNARDSFKFKKRCQLLFRSHKESLSVVAMRAWGWNLRTSLERAYPSPRVPDGTAEQKHRKATNVLSIAPVVYQKPISRATPNPILLTASTKSLSPPSPAHAQE